MSQEIVKSLFQAMSLVKLDRESVSKKTPSSGVLIDIYYRIKDIYEEDVDASLNFRSHLFSLLKSIVVYINDLNADNVRIFNADEFLSKEYDFVLNINLGRVQVNHDIR